MPSKKKLKRKLATAGHRGDHLARLLGTAENDLFDARQDLSRQTDRLARVKALCDVAERVQRQLASTGTEAPAMLTTGSVRKALAQPDVKLGPPAAPWGTK